MPLESQQPDAANRTHGGCIAFRLSPTPIILGPKKLTHVFSDERSSQAKLPPETRELVHFLLRQDLYVNQVEEIPSYAALFYCIDRIGQQKVIVKHIVSSDQFTYEKLVWLQVRASSEQAEGDLLQSSLLQIDERNQLIYLKQGDLTLREYLAYLRSQNVMWFNQCDELMNLLKQMMQIQKSLQARGLYYSSFSLDSLVLSLRPDQAGAPNRLVKYTLAVQDLGACSTYFQQVVSSDSLLFDCRYAIQAEEDRAMLERFVLGRIIQLICLQSISAYVWQSDGGGSKVCPAFEQFNKAFMADNFKNEHQQISKSLALISEFYSEDIVSALKLILVERAET